MRRLIVGDRVVTCDPSHGGELGVLERGAVLIDGDAIVAVEALDAFEGIEAERIEGPLVTPGLCDAHTHAAWVGSRGAEYAMRLEGADYEAIAREGGGIVASMRAVRAATLEELTATLRQRVARMGALGVTTVEVKSGYGLSEAAEHKQLEAIAAVAADGGVDLVPTFLGLHALPPEFQTRAAYAAACARWLERIAADGLARFADAYVERSAFSVGEARSVLERARGLGLGLRVHVGQFADVGGAEMAAELGAATVDHLEHVSRRGAARLAAAGVRAVLLPVASFTLRQAPPDVAQLRAEGVELVVASDANPGTAPTESLPLAMALAVRSYGLTVAETVLGATRRAALSLGLDRGWLRAGARADVVLWDLTSEHDLVAPWGVSRARRVWAGGRELSVAGGNGASG